MTTVTSVICAAAFVGGVTSLAAWAAEPQPSPAAARSAVADMKDIKWGPQPPQLPPGGEMAVMSGDPAATGFISLRAKLPAGYKVPPHFHPTDEHVTVLSGSMTFGMGDKIDAKTEETVRAGGYFVAKAQMHHYAIAKTATVIQIDLIGPFGITYVNPADDPMKKTP